MSIKNGLLFVGVYSLTFFVYNNKPIWWIGIALYAYCMYIILNVINKDIVKSNVNFFALLVTYPAFFLNAIVMHFMLNNVEEVKPKYVMIYVTSTWFINYIHVKYYVVWTSTIV
jgi:hypothetical protein